MAVEKKKRTPKTSQGGPMKNIGLAIVYIIVRPIGWLIDRKNR